MVGFEIYRSRGERKKMRQRKRQNKRKTRKEKNKFTATQKVAVNFGCFYYKTGEKKVTFFCIKSAHRMGRAPFFLSFSPISGRRPEACSVAGQRGLKTRRFWGLDGQNRQSPLALDFGSRTQIAALFAVLLYPNV